MLGLDGLTEALANYVEARLTLFKIEAKQELSKAVAELLHVLAIGFAAVMLLVFFSVMLAAGINALTGTGYWGWIFITALYLIIFLVLLKTRDHPRVTEKFKNIADGIFAQNKKNNTDITTHN